MLVIIPIESRLVSGEVFTFKYLRSPLFIRVEHSF